MLHMYGTYACAGRVPHTDESSQRHRRQKKTAPPKALSSSEVIRLSQPPHAHQLQSGEPDGEPPRRSTHTQTTGKRHRQTSADRRAATNAREQYIEECRGSKPLPCRLTNPSTITGDHGGRRRHPSLSCICRTPPTKKPPPHNKLTP